MVGEPGNLGSREIGNLGNTAGNKPFAPLELWPFFSVISEKHPHELETKGVDSAPQSFTGAHLPSPSNYHAAMICDQARINASHIPSARRREDSLHEQDREL